MSPAETVKAASVKAREEILAQSRRFQSGEINFAQWREGCAQEIKMAHAYAYLAGIGGPDAMNELRRAEMEKIILHRLDAMMGACVTFGNHNDFDAIFQATYRLGDINCTFQNARRVHTPHQWERRVLGEGERNPECIAIAGQGWSRVHSLPPLALGCHCEFQLCDDPATFDHDVSDEQRDKTGKWTKGEGDEPKADDKRKGMNAFRKAARGFKALKEKVGHAEHAAIGAFQKQWAKLPKPVRVVAKGLLTATFSSYIAGEHLAGKIAEEVGGKEHAARVAKALIGYDLLAAKIGPASVGAIAGPAAAGVAYWLPLASLAYVTYSMARHPIATYRAAKGVVSHVYHTGKHLAAKVGFDADQKDVSALLDAFQRHSDAADWYEALLMSALDKTRNIVSAIKVADAAYENMPRQPEGADQDDSEVVFADFDKKGYDPNEPRDPHGLWTKGAGEKKNAAGTKEPVDKAANRPSKPSERKVRTPPMLPMKHPTTWPLNKNKAKEMGLSVTGNAANGMTGTFFGDFGEAISSLLGFRNILPEGKRCHTAAEKEEKGSSVDREWDHSGWIMEVKSQSVESSEYKNGRKGDKEARQKERYAKIHKCNLATMYGIVDTDAGIARYYWTPGMVAEKLTPDKVGAEGNQGDSEWHYAGEVRFNGKLWRAAGEIKREMTNLQKQIKEFKKKAKSKEEKEFIVKEGAKRMAKLGASFQKAWDKAMANSKRAE